MTLECFERLVWLTSSLGDVQQGKLATSSVTMVIFMCLVDAAGVRTGP